MPALTVEQATEEIYRSLAAENEDIDQHIKNLKTALAEAGSREALIDATRLPHNNRAGRKTMQTYFRKRGVMVVFGEMKDTATSVATATAAAK